LMSSPRFWLASDQTRSAVVSDPLEACHAGLRFKVFLLQAEH
jgi:hypothetical protein